jgi:hypothetical protein
MRRWMADRCHPYLHSLECRVPSKETSSCHESQKREIGHPTTPVRKPSLDEPAETFKISYVFCGR